MLKVMLPFVLIFFLVIAMYIAYQREKVWDKRIEKCGNFYLLFSLAILNMFAYWFHFGGAFTWLYYC